MLKRCHTFCSIFCIIIRNCAPYYNLIILIKNIFNKKCCGIKWIVMSTRTQYSMRDVENREPADKNAKKHLPAIIDY